MRFTRHSWLGLLWLMCLFPRHGYNFTGVEPFADPSSVGPLTPRRHASPHPCPGPSTLALGT